MHFVTFFVNFPRFHRIFSKKNCTFAGKIDNVMKRILFVLVAACAILNLSAQETYLFAQKDTASLYLDIHRPSLGAITVLDSLQKPTILYVFGGGFKSGARNSEYQLKWFKTLNDNGYTVVAIDYRLGMKHYKMGKGFIGIAKSVNQFYESQKMGVEDVFSAISFLAQHPELNIDIHNIVMAGSSAGAIISLASAYTVANANAKTTKYTISRDELPENFQFKGVLSFAGGVISLNGAPKFQSAPCPILFFHGLNDNAVAYKHVGAFGKGIWGSSFIVSKFKNKGYNYSIWRFKDRAHDVAAYMNLLLPEELAFLENNVIRSTPRIIDAMVDNPALPVWKAWSTMTPQEMYNGE